MNEFFSVIFSPANAIPTGFFLLIIVYWITVILGAMDMESISVDVDADVDLDVDVDAGHGPDFDVEVDSDVSMDGNPSHDISYLNYILKFLNIGKVPFMLWLSFVVLPMWAISLLITTQLGIESFFPGLIVWLPTFIGCMLLAKFLTWPFVKIFEKLDQEDMKVDLVGSVGVVSTTIFDNSKGQVNLTLNGSSFTILARSLEGGQIKKGTQVLVIKIGESKDIYLVEPYTHQ